jgi:hypothetical protein
MTKELPGWLNKSARLISNQHADFPSMGIFQKRDLSERWGAVTDEITSYINKWESLQVNRIFGDLSEYAFHESYSQQLQNSGKSSYAYPGTLCVSDSFGSLKYLDGNAYHGQFPNSQETLKNNLLELQENGIQPEDVHFSSLTSTIYHRESYGSGDETYYKDVTDFVIRMDKSSLTVTHSPTNETLFKMALEKIDNYHTLEKAVDEFSSKFLEEQKNASLISIERKNKKDNLSKILSDLQIPQFLKLPHMNHEIYFVNIGEEGEPKFNQFISDWIKGEEAVAIRVVSSSVIANPRAEVSKITVKYSLMIITASGRIGIPAKNGAFASRDIKDFPIGGRGFQSKSQINPALEKLIMETYNNPQFVAERPWHSEPSQR